MRGGVAVGARSCRLAVTASKVCDDTIGVTSTMVQSPGASRALVQWDCRRRQQTLWSRTNLKNTICFNRHPVYQKIRTRHADAC